MLASIHVFMGTPKCIPQHTTIVLTQIVIYGEVDMSGKNEYTPIIPMGEHHEFKASLGYLVLKARK